MLYLQPSLLWWMLLPPQLCHVSHHAALTSLENWPSAPGVEPSTSGALRWGETERLGLQGGSCRPLSFREVGQSQTMGAVLPSAIVTFFPQAAAAPP